MHRLTPIKRKSAYMHSYAYSIQGILGKFDRWACHYQKVCHGMIEHHFKSEALDFCSECNKENHQLNC